MTTLLNRLRMLSPRNRLIAEKENLALFCEEMADWLERGVDIPTALHGTSVRFGDNAFRAEVAALVDLVDAGFSLTHAVKTCEAFPPMLVAMVKAGEEARLPPRPSDALSDLLHKAANIYLADAEHLSGTPTRRSQDVNAR